MPIWSGCGCATHAPCPPPPHLSLTFGRPHFAGEPSGLPSCPKPLLGPEISPTSPAPGKPLALRLPTTYQAAAPVSPGRQKSEQRTPNRADLTVRLVFAFSCKNTRLRDPPVCASIGTVRKGRM